MTRASRGREPAAARAIRDYIWQTRYRGRRRDGTPEASLAETWRRVARAVAEVEPRERSRWEATFDEALGDLRFLPAGRIIFGAGAAASGAGAADSGAGAAAAGAGARAEPPATLLNCFVMGPIEGDLPRVIDALRESAVTLAQGGGIGCDFSALAPAGMPAGAGRGVSPGPVAAMHIWNASCAAVNATGARRGAMMATLACDHPEIEAFIDAKAEPQALSYFNCSVLVSDAFMQAVADDAEWCLRFPTASASAHSGEGPAQRPGAPPHGTGDAEVCERVSARALWRRLMRATYRYAEPGVLFIDRINQQNNLYYCEHITATNPCGEVPLPHYGACDLGSFNLTAFVREAFTDRARLDLDAIGRLVPVAVRLLDDVLELTDYPLAEQAAQARRARRIGIGITGLGDALAMLNLHYAATAARRQAAAVMETIRNAAWSASIELARERGPCPAYDRDRFLEGHNARALPEALRRRLARYGIRNSHLTAIAPTGSISLLAGNVSSGIEPIFRYRQQRRIREPKSGSRTVPLQDYAYALWRERHGEAALPAAFVTAAELDAQAHLAMAGAVAPFIDSAIAKTINVAEDEDFERFEAVYRQAYAAGLKGCTTYRSNAITGVVLAAESACSPGGVSCVPME